MLIRVGFIRLPESAAVIQDLVACFKRDDALEPPARRLSILGSIADELLRRVQQQVAQAASDSGWKPKAFRRGGDQQTQLVSDTAAAGKGERDSVGGSEGGDVRKPRRGFEELLPADWRAEATETAFDERQVCRCFYVAKLCRIWSH